MPQEKTSKGFDPTRRRVLRDMGKYAVGAAATGAALSALALQSKQTYSILGDVSQISNISINI